MQDKNDVKTQRIRGFFLDAAREMITTEGVENFSVRKVAQKAGYSYATIYHYFKDVEELLAHTKRVMVEDTAKYMQAVMSTPPKNEAELQMLFTAYVRYHLEQPQVFRFFYFYKLPDHTAEAWDFSAMWRETLHFLVQSGTIEDEELETCAKTLVYTVHGLLTLYLSGNGLNEVTLFTELKKAIHYIIRG